jgi:hypothetical protein
LPHGQRIQDTRRSKQAIHERRSIFIESNQSSNDVNLENKFGPAKKERQVQGGDEWIPGVGAPWLWEIPGHARHEIMTQRRNHNSFVKEAQTHEILEMLQYIHLVQSNLAKEDWGNCSDFGFRQNQAAFDVELPRIVYQDVLDLKYRISKVEFDVESIRVATNAILKFTKATGSGVMAIALFFQAYDDHCSEIGKLPYLCVLDSCLNLEYTAKYGDHYALRLYGSTDLNLIKIFEPMIPRLLSGVCGMESCIVETKEILKGWTIRDYFSEEVKQYIKDFSSNGLGPLASDPRLNKKRKFSSE